MATSKKKSAKVSAKKPVMRKPAPRRQGCGGPRDTRWPGKWADLNAPVPAAIRRMLDRGIEPQDLTDVVRDAQIDALYNVAQLLEHCGHGIEDQQAKIAENVEWRLVEYDGNTGEMRRVIGGLHEDFFDMDPTGRGGQPRSP